MKFNAEKMKEISRPMTHSEREEIEDRNENREWLVLSAKFALLLRQILRTEKMTQTELAARMGVSCARITKLLSGKENICLQTIAKVEKALGRGLVSFCDITEQSDQANKFFSPVHHIPPETYSAREVSPKSFSMLSTDKILV